MTDTIAGSANGDGGSNPRDLTGKVCGDFRILRRLGQGGMGQVYLAEQLSLKRKVALKFLKPELSANPTSLQRFKREAEAVAKATHSNIVQIYSLGETEGQQFMALEYVEGKNLREFIEKKGPPDVRLGLRIISQVASALQQSSELGIVHRDIKPENILINRKGEVKVTDFGLSRLFKQDSNLTESRIAMGTPLYMSPEQVEGKPVDHRSDIYSFGVTCYHLFAGQPPFRGQTPFEVALQHVNKEAVPLAEIRPDLPPDLCLLIHKMMMKRPEARYQTGREIVRDVSRLRDALIQSGGHLTAPALPNLAFSGTLLNLGPNEGTDALTISSVGKQRPPRRPLLFAGVLAAALGAGLALGWFVTPAPIRAVPTPTAPPEGQTADAPAAVKELFFAREREKELQRRVQESLKSPIERGLGLEPMMDLGALYLRDRKLDEADAYFKDLQRNDRRFPQYRIIGQFGQAMVLSYRDQPLESNKAFLETLDGIHRLEAKLEALPAKNGDIKKDKTPLRSSFSQFWKQNVAWAEQLAQTLNRNVSNAPDAFPNDPRLQALRKPPLPKPLATP
ncbi:MAG: serine/threonine-protein kinase [Planctomycetota bacterium]